MKTVSCYHCVDYLLFLLIFVICKYQICKLTPLWAYKLIRIHVIINGYNMTFIQIIVPTSRLMVTSKRNIWYHIWAFIFNWEPIIILCTLRPLSIALTCIPYWDIQCRSYTVVYHHHPYLNVYFFWCKLWEPRNK